MFHHGRWLLPSIYWVKRVRNRRSLFSEVNVDNAYESIECVVRSALLYSIAIPPQVNDAREARKANTHQRLVSLFIAIQSNLNRNRLAFTPLALTCTTLSGSLDLAFAFASMFAAVLCAHCSWIGHMVAHCSRFSIRLRKIHYNVQRTRKKKTSTRINWVVWRPFINVDRFAIIRNSLSYAIFLCSTYIISPTPLHRSLTRCTLSLGCSSVRQYVSQFSTCVDRGIENANNNNVCYCCEFVSFIVGIDFSWTKKGKKWKEVRLRLYNLIKFTIIVMLCAWFNALQWAFPFRIYERQPDTQHKVMMYLFFGVKRTAYLTRVQREQKIDFIFCFLRFAIYFFVGPHFGHWSVHIVAHKKIHTLNGCGQCDRIGWWPNRYFSKVCKNLFIFINNFWICSGCLSVPSTIPVLIMLLTANANTFSMQVARAFAIY